MGQPTKIKPPVAYQGGKARLAEQIVDLLPLADCHTFCDLCCGSGAVALEVVSRGFDPTRVVMLDAGPWGAFWSAVGSGRFDLDRFRAYCDAIPSDPRLIQAHVRELSRAPADRDTEYVFPILQAAAFGGKAIWTEGGRWANASFRAYWEPTATSSRRSPVNPMMPMPSTLVERVGQVVESMRGVRAECRRAEGFAPPAGALVYVDPPYDGTTGYGHGLDVLDLVARLDCQTYVSEGRPLSVEAVLLSGGRSKGGITGTRRSANEEWLSVFSAGAVACSTYAPDFLHPEPEWRSVCTTCLHHAGDHNLARP